MVKRRKDIRDVFNAYMNKNVKQWDTLGIPVCAATLNQFPAKIITFEEARAEVKKPHPDFNAVVCFYKDDYKFDGGAEGNLVSFRALA